MNTTEKLITKENCIEALNEFARIGSIGPVEVKSAAWDTVFDFCEQHGMRCISKEGKSLTGIEGVIHFIDNNITEWISVKDRLPKESGRYWCYVKDINELGTSYFQWNCCYHDKERKFTDSTLTNGENVTHWMPLPEPPKQ